MPKTSPDELDLNLLAASMQVALDTAQQSMDLIRTTLLTGRTEQGVDKKVLTAALRSVPRWHFAMLNDLERNDAFAVALERVLPDGGHVLDIGSGTGVLAMMVARAGATSVTTCEQNPLLAEIARQIIAEHGMSDVITVVPKRSTDLVVGVDMPRKADLIVSEVVDCGLVGEGILRTMEHARRHLLAPGGTLLPESARIFGALLDSVAVDRLNRVDFAGEFDVALLNRLATPGHFPVRLLTWPHRLLSPAVEMQSFDFYSDPPVDGSVEVELEATVAGTAHGLVVWFEMSLGGGIILRNSPDNRASHWMQAFISFPDPMDLSEGDRVRMILSWLDGQLSASDISISSMAEEQR